MKKRRKILSLLLCVALAISMMPVTGAVVYAADTTNELPTVEQFATVEQLKLFNTDDTNDGTKNRAKVYFGANPDTQAAQQWWIAGSQQEHGLTLFAASPLATGQQFEPTLNQNKTYDSSWNCTYPNGDPSEVYPNHYGASPLRNTLQDMTDENNTTYFSESEQALMNVTTVYTNDEKYQDDKGETGQEDTALKKESVYSIMDKLYLPYGDRQSGNDKYITVGNNYVPEDIEKVSDLNNGLRVDMDYWGNMYFWLRAPIYDDRNVALAAFPDQYVGGRVVNDVDAVNHRALVPAFELNLSSFIFASAAPAASTSDLTLQDTDGDGAFTLRYKSDTLGSALVSYGKSKVTLTGVPSGTYLVVQNSDGAKAKQITTETEVSARDMGLDGFANCKVWLETTDTINRMTYATLATEEQGTAVNITANTGLSITSNNGVQEVAPNTAITDITVEVANGYYLSDDYISNLQSQLSGLSVSKTDNGFTISGTPTSDVNITLLAAAEKSENQATPDVTGGIGSTISGTTTAMEYAASETSAVWTTCTDGTTEVGAGTWYVRYKETDTQKASAAVKVVVTAPEINPPTPPIVITYYDITADQPEHGTITLERDRIYRYGDVDVTLTPEEGYEVKGLLINGVSVGAVSNYTIKDVTEDIHVTAVFGETEAAKKARIIKGVRETDIELTYKMNEIGRGFIKIRWTKEKGYAVDYYEVFRSAKNKSNFSKEAYFTKNTAKLNSWYKNTKEIKKGTRYYYKVRGVREIDGKTYYTKWSNTTWRTGR